MLSFENVLTGIMVIPALYMWRNLYSTYRTLKQEYQEEQIFHERHNCVIMYSTRNIRGWPPDYNIKIDTNNLDRFFEPYLYFINSAKCSLSIAMMQIGMNPLLESLEKAVERGVQVKLIVDFLSVKSMQEKYEKLLKAGVKIAFYVDKTEKRNYIMHCKYMIKDYDVNSGYLCMGSMNLTGISTMISNFEDVTFTSNICVVGEFQRNFEDSWSMINRDNENVYNKTVLSACGFLQ